MNLKLILIKSINIIRCLVSGSTFPTWHQIEYFNPEWKIRIRTMSQYIGKNDSVVDLGCGEMWLKCFLEPSNKYTGVDYRKRDENTIICDFNKGMYPNINADVYFISGCLEYVVNYESLIDNISNYCRMCILSYCCIEDFPDMILRRKRAWVNDLGKLQLINIFASKGMELTNEAKTLTNNSIFIFRKRGHSDG